MFDSKFSRYLLAGMWFASAAVVATIYYFLLFDNAGPFFRRSSILITAISINVSGMCGFLLGSSILDVDKVKNGIQAAMCGISVAILSYLLLFTIPALFFAFFMSNSILLFFSEIFIFMYGKLSIGLLMAISGTVAGLLLYLCRVKIIGGRAERRTI